jgi:hypothetical protein
MTSMTGHDVRRRRFIQLIGCAAGAAFAGCRPARELSEEIADLLELRDEERAWLATLPEDDLRRLFAGLTAPDVSADAAARVIAQLLRPRARLSAFVRYPAIGDLRVVCDGLIRE